MIKTILLTQQYISHVLEFYLSQGICKLSNSSIPSPSMDPFYNDSDTTFLGAIGLLSLDHVNVIFAEV